VRRRAKPGFASEFGIPVRSLGSRGTQQCAPITPMKSALAPQIRIARCPREVHSKESLNGAVPAARRRTHGSGSASRKSNPDSAPAHSACFFRRCNDLHSGLLQACCREPTRLSGRNQRWQTQQGRFRATGMMIHHPQALCLRTHSLWNSKTASI